MPMPVRYSPDVEQVQPDEAETIRQLEEQFQTIQDTTSKDYGHAARGAHAKGHGVATGTLTIKSGLPPEFAQGLFASPGEHEAIIRISTNPGDLLDDSIGLPRGLALKVLGVEGARLPGSEGDTTQDFVLVNGPVFASKTPKQFLANLKMLAKTTDKTESAKKVLSGVLRAAEAVLETVHLPSPTLQQLGGAPNVHPLGQTYYSQTPFRHGEYIAKYRLKPISAALKALVDLPLKIIGPDTVREETDRALIEHGGEWALEAQLCTDLEKMPIEDPTGQWDEEASRFETVATLSVEPQRGWRKGVTENEEDALAFSPWHGLAAHQPLGGVNRARREPYEKSVGFRAGFNGCPIHEPRTLAEVAG